MEEDEQAMLTLEAPSGRDSGSIISPLSLRGGFSVELEDTSESIRARMATQRQSSSGQIRHRHVSSSSESILSGSDGSFSGGAAPTSPLSSNTAHSLSQSMLGKISHTRGRSDQIIYDGLTDGWAIDKVFREDKSDVQEKQSADKISDSSNTEFEQSNVMEAVSSAMQHLRRVRLKEQLARPVRYEPQNTLHKPDPATVKIFEASVNEELQIRRLITRDWLRVATWWLLKARATLANCNRHNFVSARGSVSPSTDSKTTSHQAYADLLKASYILYDIVLKDESSPALLTDENRKSIADLSEVGDIPSLSYIFGC